MRNTPPPGARIVGRFYGGQSMRWIVDIDADWLQPQGTAPKSKAHFPIRHADHEGLGALCSQAFMRLDPGRLAVEGRGYCVTCYRMLIHHNEYKENTMPSTADLLRQQMSALASEISRLESLPKEPKGDDDIVIFFEKSFRQEPRKWTYSAVKAGDGLWYTTGPRSPKGYTWQQLIEWIVGDEETQPQVWLATHWTELV